MYTYLGIYDPLCTQNTKRTEGNKQKTKKKWKITSFWGAWSGKYFRYKADGRVRISAVLGGEYTFVRKYNISICISSPPPYRRTYNNIPTQVFRKQTAKTIILSDTTSTSIYVWCIILKLHYHRARIIIIGVSTPKRIEILFSAVGRLITAVIVRRPSSRYYTTSTLRHTRFVSGGYRRH